MEITANNSLSNLSWVTPFEAALLQLPNLADGMEHCQVALPSLQRGAVWTLPSLQRGAVWRPRQVEALWDSLIRGFPIGSFLLAPYDPNDPYDQRRGSRLPRYGPPPRNVDHDLLDGQKCYHLLDGQQRWNAITLGFVNIWKSNPEFQDDGLWVDLDKPKDLLDGRKFIFRVVTRSHPWGYRRDDPNSRLNAQNRREALEAYECAYKETHSSIGTGNNISFRPGKLSLTHAWPWDAIAPVPFIFIAEAVKKGAFGRDLWAMVRQSMECLPYWCVEHLHNRISGRDWKAAVCKCLDDPTPYMESLALGVIGNLGMDGRSEYRIPILQLSPESMELPDKEGGPERPDALETLFVRVNSEGTRLEGEDLNYSILKSIYPDAEKLVEGSSHRLMPPSRLVTFVSRLVLATSKDGTPEKTPPSEPNVARFRRLIRGTDRDFSERMWKYIGLNESGKPTEEKSDAAKLLKYAKVLLTLSPNAGASYRLPPVLVTDLARRSQDAFFMLLVWLDRMRKAGKDPENIGDDDRRRIVGVITTLGWFAPRPDKCLETLWQRLTRSDPENFFAAGVLNECLQRTDREVIQLIRPLRPPLLKEAIKKCVTLAPGFSDPESEFWKKRPLSS